MNHLYISINENELYYEIHGNPEGKTIFFIHGAPGLSDCRADIKAFSSLGDQYQLVFLDMRGSGRSEGKPPFTHEQWTADIEELRKELVGVANKNSWRFLWWFSDLRICITISQQCNTCIASRYRSK